jgi:hypothetical protein
MEKLFLIIIINQLYRLKDEIRISKHDLPLRVIQKRYVLLHGFCFAIERHSETLRFITQKRVIKRKVSE